MTRVKNWGLGALLLLMALIATGCLEQPGSAWKTTQPEEPPVVIIDGTGNRQESPAADIKAVVPTPTKGMEVEEGIPAGMKRTPEGIRSLVRESSEFYTDPNHQK